MKILFLRWSFCPLMHRIVRGLKQLGHEVAIYHANGLPLHITGDIAFFYHPWRHDIPTSQARSQAKVSILWTVEDPYEMNFAEKAGKEVDLIWDMDRNSAQHLRSVLGKPVLHVPHCYYPQPGYNVIPIPSDVCFIGNDFPWRVKTIQAVKKELSLHDTLLVGGGWKRTAPWARTARSYSSRESLAAIQGAKVCLNLHRQSDVDQANRHKIRPSSPNNRLFDIAAAGKVQLVDNTRMPELLEYFSPDEISIFENPGDFMSKLRKLLAMSAEQRDVIGARAKARVDLQHTAAIRFKQALLETEEIL